MPVLLKAGMTREISSLMDDLEFPEDATTRQDVHGYYRCHSVWVSQCWQSHVSHLNRLTLSSYQSWLSPVERPHTLDSGAGWTALQSPPIRGALTSSLYTVNTVSCYAIGHHHTWRRKLVYFPEVSTWLTAMISLMFIVAHARDIQHRTIFQWGAAICLEIL